MRRGTDNSNCTSHRIRFLNFVASRSSSNKGNRIQYFYTSPLVSCQEPELLLPCEVFGVRLHPNPYLSLRRSFLVFETDASSPVVFLERKKLHQQTLFRIAALLFQKNNVKEIENAISRRFLPYSNSCNEPSYSFTVQSLLGIDCTLRCR